MNLCIQLLSLSMGSVYTNSTKCRWKIFRKKIPENSKNQNLKFLSTRNYLHNTNITLGTISNLEML